MDNEPEAPRSSVPPPPDLPPPRPTPPPPDLTPPTPVAPPLPDLPPPPTPVDPPVHAAAKSGKLKMDDEEDESPKAGGDAGFEARVVAAIIDSFIAVGIYMVLAAMWKPLGNLALLGYLLARDALPFLEGQSIGKKIMKLRAVTMDGKSLSGNWQASIVRNLSLVIPFFGLVEAYMLYSRQGGDGPLQRFGDEWAKTRVITVTAPPAI